MGNTKKSEGELTQVAFLRAINVGGHRVTNDELAQVFSGLGFASVTPYQTSGNVMLSAYDGNSRDTEAAIERALEDAFGYPVPTMIRTKGEVEAIAAAQPFTPEVVAETSGKVQVMFFKRALSEDQRTEVLAQRTPDDRILVDRTEVYWLPTEGISTSDLRVGALNKSVGPITVRTQATIGRIVKKLTG